MKGLVYSGWFHSFKSGASVEMIKVLKG